MRFPADVPVLTSGDVTLRAHHLDDTDAIVEQCNDPLSVRWTTVPLGYDAAMAREWLTTRIPTAWESESEYLFAIEATHDDGRRRFGGSLSLRDEGERRAEIAFGSHPGVRGRGVMTTAVEMLLDWGFNERGLQTVVWYANVGNMGSRRVAWRAGFTFGGTLKRWLVHRDEYLDGWTATLHRDDVRQPKTTWYDAVPLAGSGVALRRLDESDIPAIVEGCADDRSQHWLGDLPRPYTEDDARAWLYRMIERSSLGVAVWWGVGHPQEPEALLGTVGLRDIGHGEAEVGYWAHPTARGQGVMTEAVRVLVAHAFEPVARGGLGLRRLTLHAAAGNRASHHVARSNGFSEYGRERSTELLGDGTYDDMLLFDRHAPGVD
jgi:RimJ/RimL family protein N-acetyltransferase